VLKLRVGIIELFRKVATSLPPDVETALKDASERELEGTNAREALMRFLEEVKRARAEKSPLCMEIGIPVFYVKSPMGISQREIEMAIVDATKSAMEKLPLSEGVEKAAKGAGFPEIHMEESPDDTLTIELMLMAAECESEGRLYKLPEESLGAGRDLDGVRKCVLDAVTGAHGRGCPPYTVGVGIGASREQATRLSKEQLRRKLNDRNPDEGLDSLEDRLIGEINGPRTGGNGKVVALGVKIGGYHETGPSFVDVSLSCWANRRGKLIW
jgi:fumarate hydratase class I